MSDFRSVQVGPTAIVFKRVRAKRVKHNRNAQQPSKSTDDPFRFNQPALKKQNGIGSIIDAVLYGILALTSIIKRDHWSTGQQFD